MASEQYNMIKTMLTNGMQAEEIAKNENLFVTLGCVELILEEIEKANEIDDEKRKKIREYVFKRGVGAEEIAKIM